MRFRRHTGEEMVLAVWESPRAVELFVEKDMVDDLCALEDPL